MKTTKNLLLACTASVATIKLPLLIEKLQNLDTEFSFNVGILLMIIIPELMRNAISFPSFF